MSGLFGFGSIGLSDLDEEDIFEDKKQKEKEKLEPPKEEDFLLDKEVECPVCGNKSNQKILKTGKVKLISTDRDLRPKYSILDSGKYEVYQCEVCGYAALAKSFSHISPKQTEMIREGFCTRVKLRSFVQGATYTYEEALERYKLALACAMVRKAKAGEKAYICLKTAWLLRGYAEFKKEQGDTGLLAEIEKAEQDYLGEAYRGFSKAVTVESFPICGMDESTIDYLLAALAFETGNLEASSRLVYKIVQNKNAGSRVKERAINLKDEILAETRRRRNEKSEN